VTSTRTMGYDHSLRSHILLTNFTRSLQLYIYGFSKVEGSSSKGRTFSHPLFVRGNPSLSMSLGRNQAGDRRKKQHQGGRPDEAQLLATKDVLPSSSAAVPGGGTGSAGASDEPSRTTAASFPFTATARLDVDRRVVPPQPQHHRPARPQKSARSPSWGDLPPPLPSFDRPTPGTGTNQTAVDGTSLSLSSSASLHTQWEYMVDRGPSMDVMANTFQGLRGLHQQQQQSSHSTAPKGGDYLSGGLLGNDDDDDDMKLQPVPLAPNEERRLLLHRSRGMLHQKGGDGVDGGARMMFPFDQGGAAASSSPSLPAPGLAAGGDRHPPPNAPALPPYEGGGWDLEPRPIEDMVAEGLLDHPKRGPI
jgi:hypothetical protein